MRGAGREGGERGSEREKEGEGGKGETRGKEKKGEREREEAGREVVGREEEKKFVTALNNESNKQPNTVGRAFLSVYRRDLGKIEIYSLVSIVNFKVHKMFPLFIYSIKYSCSL